MEYDKTKILQRVEELGKEQPWNHQIELPCGIKTTSDIQSSHGKNLIKWSRLNKYIDIIGIKHKRVLDVGCNEGFFSIKLKEAGAKEVIGIDADDLRIKKAEFVAKTLGASGITYNVMNIFDSSTKKIGHFDFTLCLGVLHRVPYPYELLRILTEMSDMILLEWKSLKKGCFNLPIMQFCGVESEDLNPYSNLYWLPSVECVLEILKSLGFTYNFVIDNSFMRRSIVISSKFNNPVFQNKNMIAVNKLQLLTNVTKSYLNSVLAVFNDKNSRWL